MSFIALAGFIPGVSAFSISNFVSQTFNAQLKKEKLILQNLPFLRHCVKLIKKAHKTSCSASNADAHNKQMVEMVDMNFARKLTEKEMTS